MLQQMCFYRFWTDRRMMLNQPKADELQLQLACYVSFQKVIYQGFRR